MEKNKRMQFYGGTLGACAPLLVFMCLMIVIAAMKKVSLVLFCMAGFAGLCVAFLLAKNKKEFEQAVVDGLKNDTLCVIIRSSSRSCWPASCRRSCARAASFRA